MGTYLPKKKKVNASMANGRHQQNGPQELIDHHDKRGLAVGYSTGQSGSDFFVLGSGCNKP
jgi:hypothetical protein